MHPLDEAGPLVFPGVDRTAWPSPDRRSEEGCSYRWPRYVNTSAAVVAMHQRYFHPPAVSVYELYEGADWSFYITVSTSWAWSTCGPGAGLRRRPIKIHTFYLPVFYSSLVHLVPTVFLFSGSASIWQLSHFPQLLGTLFFRLP